MAAAQAAFLPQVAAQGGWELNGGALEDHAVVELGGWHGRAAQPVPRSSRTRRGWPKLASRPRVERSESEQRRRPPRASTCTIAVARLDAARASEAVGRAAVAQARESRRIVRDRYEAGLTDVASLLRAAEAVVQAETQQTAAQVDVLTASGGP